MAKLLLHEGEDPLRKRARQGTFQEASAPNEAGAFEIGYVGGHATMARSKQYRRPANGNSRGNCIIRRCWARGRISLVIRRTGVCWVRVVRTNGKGREVVDDRRQGPSSGCMLVPLRQTWAIRKIPLP